MPPLLSSGFVLIFCVIPTVPPLSRLYRGLSYAASPCGEALKFRSLRSPDKFQFSYHHGAKPPIVPTRNADTLPSPPTPSYPEEKGRILSQRSGNGAGSQLALPRRPQFSIQCLYTRQHYRPSSSMRRITSLPSVSSFLPRM